MREVFQQELREVRERLVEIAELVAVSIDNATTAFNESNVSLAETVIADDTRIDVAAAELDDDPGASRAQVFALARTVRAPQLATTQTSAVSGFGTVEAVKGQSSQAVKTWHAGSNPRSAHARLDGETVPLDVVFSNGARWPGDSQLPPDERAGCNCRMTVALQEAQ